jgi:hypothetical protein
MKYIEEDKKEKDIIKIKSDLVLTKKALRIKGLSAFSINKKILWKIY